MIKNIDNSIILSIRPEFAQRIYTGDKRVELRKIFAKDPIRYVFLLETDGVKKITGFFEPGPIHRGSVSQLAQYAKTIGYPRDRYFNYFNTWKTGCIIEIRSAHKLSNPLELRDIVEVSKNFRIPQGFLYLNKYPPVKELLESHLSANIDSQSDFSLEVIPQSAHKDFRDLAIRHVGAFYDEIDPSFADRLLECTTRGLDPYGYFTRSKTVYNINHRNQHIGYTTLTRKRGNAVKTGPTILFPESRNRGLGTKFRSFLDDLLSGQGVRKVYCTCPDNSIATIRYLLKSHYRIEAHCFSQYSLTHGDFVFGKLLQNPRLATIRLPRRPEKNHRITLNDLSKSMFTRHFKSAFSEYYCKVDDDFITTLVQSCRSFSEHDMFYRKEKLIFIARGKTSPHSLCILSPKRGGAYKLTFVFRTSLRDSITETLTLIENELKYRGARKIYTAFPIQDSLMYEILKSKGFELEGCIAEPYRCGIDMLQVAKAI